MHRRHDVGDITFCDELLWCAVGLFDKMAKEKLQSIKGTMNVDLGFGGRVVSNTFPLHRSYEMCTSCRKLKV